MNGFVDYFFDGDGNPHRDITTEKENMLAVYKRAERKAKEYEGYGDDRRFRANLRYRYYEKAAAYYHRTRKYRCMYEYLRKIWDDKGHLNARFWDLKRERECEYKMTILMGDMKDSLKEWEAFKAREEAAQKRSDKRQEEKAKRMEKWTSNKHGRRRGRSASK